MMKPAFDLAVGETGPRMASSLVWAPQEVCTEATTPALDFQGLCSHPFTVSRRKDLLQVLDFRMMVHQAWKSQLTGPTPLGAGAHALLNSPALASRPGWEGCLI